MNVDRKKLLVVDDVEINRMILRVLFEKEFEVIEAENGVVAIEKIEEYKDELSIVLLDIVMPQKDGFDVLIYMNKKDYISTIPVIMISGEADEEKALKGYQLGMSDLIEKPFNSDVIHKRVENIVLLYNHQRSLEEQLDEYKRRFDEQTKKIKESNQFVIDTLSTTVEFRSLESGEHIRRVRTLTKTFLEHMRGRYKFDKNEIEIISNAAAIHDIGKIAIPDAILHKPGLLTTEEFEIMKTHTIKGCEILENLNEEQDMEYYNYYYDICRYHHERWDGKGYPEGLVGDEIPIWAQATGLADVYDALVNKRVYKGAIPHDTAIKMILEGECGAFNPALIEALLEIKDVLKKETEESQKKESETHRRLNAEKLAKTKHLEQ